THQDDRCSRCSHASEEDCQVDQPRAGCVAARLYWNSSQSHYTRHDPKVRSWSEVEIFTATLSRHSPAGEEDVHRKKLYSQCQQHSNENNDDQNTLSVLTHSRPAGCSSLLPQSGDTGRITRSGAAFDPANEEMQARLGRAPSAATGRKSLRSCLQQ